MDQGIGERLRLSDRKRGDNPFIQEEDNYFLEHMSKSISMMGQHPLWALIVPSILILLAVPMNFLHGWLGDNPNPWISTTILLATIVLLTGHRHNIAEIARGRRGGIKSYSDALDKSLRLILGSTTIILIVLGTLFGGALVSSNLAMLNNRIAGHESIELALSGVVILGILMGTMIVIISTASTMGEMGLIKAMDENKSIWRAVLEIWAQSEGKRINLCTQCTALWILSGIGLTLGIGGISLATNRLTPQMYLIVLAGVASSVFILTWSEAARGRIYAEIARRPTEFNISKRQVNTLTGISVIIALGGILMLSTPAPVVKLLNRIQNPKNTRTEYPKKAIYKPITTPQRQQTIERKRH